MHISMTTIAARVGTVAPPVRDVLCQWVPRDSLTLYVSKGAYLLDE